jgi:hypothetical protein
MSVSSGFKTVDGTNDDPMQQKSKDVCELRWKDVRG